MPNRISKKTTHKVSVWDVHVLVKDGFVDFSGEPWPAKLTGWLGWMLSDRKNTTVPPNLKWEESLSKLFEVFQKHNEDVFGKTFFDGVEMLHFLKFSLLEKKVGNKQRHFFCFSTQFDDTAGEQVYTDVMYKNYGALLEVVWRHCEGVTKVLKTEPTDLPDPFVLNPDPSISLNDYTLANSFLTIVDDGNVDQNEKLCFYNSNRGVSSRNVKTFKKDSIRLGKVDAAAKKARDDFNGGIVPCGEILETLLKALEP